MTVPWPQETLETASGKNLLLQAFLFVLNFKAGARFFLLQQMSPIRLLGKALQPE